MKLTTLIVRNSLVLLGGIFVFSSLQAAAQTNPAAARVTQAIDEKNLVQLKGNVHPLARAEFDQGAAPADLPMQRMLLVLKRSTAQQSALQQFMVDQYNAASTNYHKWLTPEEFGAQYGPADSDIQAVTFWLQANGFQVPRVTKGKIAVEFSGTAAQVQKAFHTQIRKYVVNGESHWANASDPQIPAALTPVVHGVASLHNFRPKPMHHVAGEFSGSRAASGVKLATPEFTTSGGNFAIGPTDFATIYNVLPLWNATTVIDGTGQSIAVVGVSNINVQDVQDFRTLFGLPTGGAANTPLVVIDGSDPGVINNGSESEALLDVEWSGAVAKNAQIHLVIAADTDIADGLLLAIFHVIENNSDPIMSVSFGACEPALGTTGNQALQFLWEQAAAQGITVTVATGDSGSAGCEDQNAAAPNPATTGLQVSGYASTPFNVAVGGTDFNDAGTQSTYFNATNDPTTLGSAKGYVPESTWNESCTNSLFGANAETNCNAAANAADVITVAGSGGSSHCFTLTGTTCSGGYPKPAFQSFSGLTGMPADGRRDIPDVSLFASDGFNKSFYVICEADFGTINPAQSCKGSPFQFLGVGGTSASTPSFAGVLALVNQNEVAHGRSGRQGNANFILYKLAQAQFAASTACNSVASPLPNAACTFNDVTVGTIAMPCTKGSLDCTTSVSTDADGVLNGFNAGTGYDLATGLGSVNAANLVNNWVNGATTFTATQTTLTLTLPAGFTAGQNASVSIAVSPKTGTGTPTGDVSLVSNAATGEGVDGFTLTNGAVSSTTNQLTGGTYMVTAHYAGDGTFAPSDSTPVTVTVSKASSTSVASVLVSIGGGNFAPFTSGTTPVTLFLQATVNPSGVLLPFGTVNFVDTVNGSTTTVVSNVPLNSAGEAFTVGGISTFTAGTHSIVAQYSGDASFNSSTSAAVTFSLSAPGSFTLSGAAATATAGASGNSTVTVTPTGGFTGTVAVTCTAASLPPGVSCSPSPLNIAVTGASAATGALTVSVTAPSTTLTATASREERIFAANANPTRFGGNRWWRVSAGTGFAALLLFFLPGRRRYRAALAMSLVCVVSFALGCGGGSSGGGGGGGPVATSTRLTATSGKVASGGTFALSVTVTGGTPAGQVQLFDGTTAIGTAVAVTAGAASITSPALSVGTHSISAHYLGDANTLASQSGALNLTVTGTTTVAITSSPASSNASPSVSLTIN